MKKCVKCGTELIDQARFCTHCRAPQPMPEEMMQAGAPYAGNMMNQVPIAQGNGPKKGKGPLIAIIAAIVLVLAVGGGFAAYHFVGVKAEEDEDERSERRSDKDDEKDSKDDEKDSKDDEKDSKDDEKDSKDDEKDSKDDEKDSKDDEKDSKDDEASTADLEDDKIESHASSSELASATVNDKTFELNGKMYQFPSKVSDYIDGGFVFSEFEDTTELKENEATSISLDFPGSDDKLYLEVYNDGSDTVSIYEAKVNGFSLTRSKYSEENRIEFILPGGITGNTSQENIQELLPELETKGADEDGWTIYSNPVDYGTDEHTELRIYYTEGNMYSVDYRYSF